jgi:hypothetical protein
MRGPAGYGRYDDDPAHVGCPWARSSMSPCIARDGRLALAAGQDEVCTGCGLTPEHHVEDLAAYYEPAGAIMPGDPATMADEFAEMVRTMTEPGREIR